MSGAALGSRQFDQVLSDPYTLHAPDTLSSSLRYGALSAMLEGAAEVPEWLDVGSSSITIMLPAGSDPAAGLDQLIDSSLNAHTQEITR